MITSTNNPRVRYARSLLRRRVRVRERRLLLEGSRLVEDAWRAGLRPAFLFVAPEMLPSEILRRLEAAARADGVEWLACTPEVVATLSDTVTPQGIAAVVPQPQPAAPLQPTLLLVLDNVRDPGNVGACLRAAAAAGADGAIVLPGCADLWSPKVLRAGMGAHFRLPVWRPMRVEESAAWLDGLPLWLAESSATRTYDCVDWTQPSALAVGGEAHGASHWMRQHATDEVAIPMHADSESLNAASAAAVILFEAARQRRMAQKSNYFIKL